MIRKLEYVEPSIKIAQFKAEQGFAITGFHVEKPVGMDNPIDNDLTGSTFGIGSGQDVHNGWNSDPEAGGWY